MKFLTALLYLQVTIGIGRAADIPTTLTFDDVALGPGEYEPLQNGYGGLDWSNFGAFNVSQFVATSGYRIGMVSPANVIFNFSGNPAKMSRDDGFTLHSAYLTSSLDLRVGTVAIHIRVQGTVGTNVTYDNTYTVSNTAPALVHFNYVGVDRVIFVASPDAPFAVDNLTVTVPPPDASCTYVVSPRSRLHGFSSETGAVSVATQPGCAWSVLNTNTWITILSSVNNSGSGTVVYAVEAEPLGTARSGFINIAGQAFMISRSDRPIVDPDLLTFDDLLPYPVFMPSGYGGLHWQGFGVIDGSVLDATLGYRTGLVSPDNVAFNLFGNPVSISSDTPFALKSAYLTELVANRMQLRVSGWLGTTLAYDNTYVLNAAGPLFVEFNYVAVDRVTFTPMPGSIFVMDNLRAIVARDSDGDGVLDSADECPETAPGAVVNEHGCSIEQLVPCAGPAEDGAWRSHGEYFLTVARAAVAFQSSGLITESEKRAIIRAAIHSDCGKSKN